MVERPSGATIVSPCCSTMFRSASVRTHDTQSADMTSASVSSAVTTPPPPRANPPSGRGSCGARLLTTTVELCGSGRVTELRIDEPGRRRSTLCRNGLSAIRPSYVGVGDGIGDGLGLGDGLGPDDGDELGHGAMPGD